ncbi:hypothetical protein GQR58_000714 [Nymphon striatum]|nr:hypothetical protein GQR58_000714 [Nymphon striatum]
MTSAAIPKAMRQSGRACVAGTHDGKSYMKNLSKNSRLVVKKVEQVLAPISTTKSSNGGSAKIIPLEGTCPIKNNSFQDVPGPWPSLPLIGTNWQYFVYATFQMKDSGFPPRCLAFKSPSLPKFVESCLVIKEQVMLHLNMSQ